MQFSNVISISDIINILLSFGTIITIVLTFLTLKEMQKQRNLSIMPSIKINFNKGIMYDLSEMHLHKSKMCMSLKNQGNGIAKDLRCKVSLCDMKNKLYKNIDIKDNLIQYKFDDYQAIYMRDFVDGIVNFQSLQIDEQIDINTEGIEKLIMAIAKSELEKHNYEIPKEPLNELDLSVEKNVMINVSYRDISENNYNINFIIKLSVLVIYPKAKRISYVLKIDKIYENT